MALENPCFFWLGFTPCKADHPLPGMKLQEKEEEEEKDENRIE